MFKMPFQTNLFNAGQKVWVRRGSGAMACEVRGKHRGKNRYVTAWVSWGAKSKPNPKFKTIEVTDEFNQRMRGDCLGAEWYSRIDGANSDSAGASESPDADG